MIVAHDNWDAIVIGAGPAGAVAALQLARGGVRVLLVDKARFPRDKVCGCCVNASVATMLESLHLGDLLARLGARPTERLRLHAGGHASTVALPGGFAVSRAALDSALTAAAVEAGVEFQDATGAMLRPGTPRTVELRRGGETQTVTGGVVLASTGLAGRLLEGEPGLAPHIARASYMGCAAIAPSAPGYYEAGVIHMVHGRGGYVGLVRLEDDRLDIAAALKPAFVKQAGGPGSAVAALLAAARMPAISSVPNDPPGVWHGTPLLTRRRPRVAAGRLFVLGDAAGYVEPFTGEGIAWAIASAMAMAPIALRAVTRWDDALAAQWNREHRALLHGRQRRCRWLTRLLRPPGAAALVNRALSWMPSLARPFVASINRPWPGTVVASMAGAVG
jgi:flavin-dependent dehydrogenase